METYQALVQRLVDDGVLETPRIINAFVAINREDFMPENVKKYAGEDRPFPIGRGQTISQPYTVAKMLEWLKPDRSQRILDVGSGSGWTSALLGHIVGRGGLVIGTERIGELLQTARKNIEPYRLDWVELLYTPEGIGYEALAPYDRILVSASGREIPQSLIDQLEPSGTMVIPVSNEILVYHQPDEPEHHSGFAFVPLKT